MEKELTLRERLEMIADDYAEEKPYVKTFLDNMIADENIEKGLLDFFYHSDFFHFMRECDLEFCQELLSAHAPCEWFMLIQSVYDEEEKIREGHLPTRTDRDPEVFCREFRVYFGLGVDIELVQEAYEACESVADFRNRMKSYVQVKNDGKQSAMPVERYPMPVVNVNQGAEISLLKDRISGLEMENKELKDSLNEKNQEIDGFRNECWQLRLDIQHLKDTSSNKNDGFEIKRLSFQIKQSNERISVLEDMKNNLIAENKRLEKQCQTESEQREALAATNTELSGRVVAAENRAAGLEAQIETLQKDLENERAKPQTYVAAPEPETIVNTSEAEAPDAEEREDEAEDRDRIGGIIRIADASKQIRKKSNIFARMYSKFQERAFEQKPEHDQKNILFQKVMGMKFTKEKTQIVKKALNAGGSYLELYKMVTRNAPDEEFDDYYRSLGPAA